MPYVEDLQEIPFHRIRYIKSVHKTPTIFTDCGEFEIDTSIKALSSERLVEVIRGTLVPLRQMVTLKGDKLHTASGDVIHVSRGHIKQVREILG